LPRCARASPPDLHPRSRACTLIPALAPRCASTTAARGYCYVGVAPTVFSGEYVSPRNGMLGGQMSEVEDGIGWKVVGSEGWMMGTAMVGRDRAAAFHGRSAIPYCWRTMTSSLRSMLHDGVSQHWQGHRLASPHAHSALVPAFNPTTSLRRRVLCYVSFLAPSVSCWRSASLGDFSDASWQVSTLFWLPLARAVRVSGEMSAKAQTFSLRANSGRTLRTTR
jgi:hypothetical protein